MELLSVRTNTRFIVDYETTLLKPVIEVIVIVTKPSYKRKKDGIYKDEAFFCQGHKYYKCKSWSNSDTIKGLDSTVIIMNINSIVYRQRKCN